MEDHVGLIRTETVNGWAHISSRWIRNDLEQVCNGEFDFDAPEEGLFSGSETPIDED